MRVSSGRVAGVYSRRLAHNRRASAPVVSMRRPSGSGLSHRVVYASAESVPRPPTSRVRTSGIPFANRLIPGDGPSAARLTTEWFSVGGGQRRASVERRWQVTVLALVVASIAILTVGTASALHEPSGDQAHSVAMALAVIATNLHASAATSAGSCPASGPLGGLDTTDSVLVLVAIAVAGIGVGIAIGRVWASRSTSGGGAGKVKTEPPDPALNPQPLPPGFRPPEPEPALNPQPLPPGFKPPEPPSGGDRPT